MIRFSTEQEGVYQAGFERFDSIEALKNPIGSRLEIVRHGRKDVG